MQQNLSDHHSRHRFLPPHPALHLPISHAAAPSSSSSLKLENRSVQQHHPHERRGDGGSYDYSRDVDAMKAKIISHPQYPTLVQAYVDCQKVGAPPEVVSRLSEAATVSLNCRSSALLADPELDQFMEAYCQVLANYKEELARPHREAMDFVRRVESELNALTSGSAWVFPTGENCGLASVEEYLDGEIELPKVSPKVEDKELKQHLLKKYGGYVGNLKQEFSKKKKIGKLPKEARKKLLNWWELHCKWPYPSESEKVALAESTGLEQKQINNWFINQRKRHWKPSEDMKLIMIDGYHHQNATAVYTNGYHFLGDESSCMGR